MTKKKSIFVEIVNFDFGAPGLLMAQFIATAKKWRKFSSIWGVCGYLGGRGPARGHLNFDLPPGLARFDHNPQGQHLGAAGVRGGLRAVASGLHGRGLCGLELAAAEQIGDQGACVDHGLAGREIGLGSHAVVERCIAEGL